MLALLATIGGVAAAIAGLVIIPIVLPHSFPVLLALTPFLLLNIFAAWLIGYSYTIKPTSGTPGPR